MNEWYIFFRIFSNAYNLVLFRKMPKYCTSCFCNLLFLESLHMIKVHFYFYASGFIVFCFLFFMATLYVLDVSQSYICLRIASPYVSLVLSSYTALWISLPGASTYHLLVVPFISAQCPDQWLSHPSHLGQIVSEAKELIPSIRRDQIRHNMNTWKCWLVAENQW